MDTNIDILEEKMSGMIADTQSIQAIVNGVRYDCLDIADSHLLYAIRVLAEHCEATAGDVTAMLIEARDTERIRLNEEGI